MRVRSLEICWETEIISNPQTTLRGNYFYFLLWKRKLRFRRLINMPKAAPWNGAEVKIWKELTPFTLQTVLESKQSKFYVMYILIQ